MLRNTKSEEMTYMDDNLLKMAIIQELREAVRTKELNDELLEHLVFSLRWLLDFSRKNKITMPNLDKIERIVDRAMEIGNMLPYKHTQTNTQKETRKDGTEPLISGSVKLMAHTRIF